MEKDVKILADKLDGIIKLLVRLMAEEKSQAEQIWLLSTAGLQSEEIADTLDTSVNNVRVTLSRLKSRRKTKKNK